MEYTENKLSLARSAFILFYYFLMTLLVALLVVRLFGSLKATTYDYSSTDNTISFIQTQASISVTSKTEFENSIYQNAEIDKYDLENGYYLLTSKGLYDSANPPIFDESFLKEIFENEFYLINDYKINRVAPTDVDDFFSLYNISNPQIDYFIKGGVNLNSLGSTLINIIIYILLTVGLFIASYEVLVKDLKALPKKASAITGAILLSTLFMYIGNFFASTITAIVVSAFKSNVITSLNQAAIVAQLTSKYGFLTIIAVVALGPIVEEIIFRKSLFSLIKNQWIALVVSSLLFGLIHVTSEFSFANFIINLIPYLVSGFTLGLIYIYNKKNIWLSIFAHIITNLISVLFITLS